MSLVAVQTKVVCVIRTPLQLFNAIEACQRFHQHDLKYLILVAGSPVDLTMMQAMLASEQNWAMVKTIIFQSWHKHFYGWQLNSWLSTLKPVSTVYIGMIRHVPLHVVNVLQPAQVCILDDGNESLMIARQINAWQASPAQQGNCWRNRFLGLQLKPDQLLNARFFSVFDIQAANNTVVNNDYRCFKARVSSLPVQPDVLVIGSNLVGTYLKDQSVLLLRLTQLRQHLPAGVAHWYAPHRYEPKDLVARIEQLGYRIYQPCSILEYSQLQQGWCFAASYSFRSTAVDTLQVIYRIPGYLCQLPETDFINAQKWLECDYIWQQHPNVLHMAEIDLL